MSDVKENTHLSQSEQFRTERLDRLTPAQVRRMKQFAAERVAIALSTETSPELEAEANRYLEGAYRVAGFRPPKKIKWFDSPRQLVRLMHQKIRVWECLRIDVYDLVQDRCYNDLGRCVGNSVWTRVWDDVWNSTKNSVWHRVGENVGSSIRRYLQRYSEKRIWADVWLYIQSGWRANVKTYEDANDLALYAFFNEIFQPNNLRYFDGFSQRVSGYWLGDQIALIVRKPKVLLRDEQGRLHSDSGKAFEYRDGFGFYYWHGVEVPEKMILYPHRLTAQEILGEKNAEVRRCMIERIGLYQFFELLEREGRKPKQIDKTDKGTLWKVPLDGDPEPLVMVQVKDSSTDRSYFLRVPPHLTTVRGAIAWTFGMGEKQYQPIMET